MSWSDLNNVQCLTKNDIRTNVRNYIILEFDTDRATTRSQVPIEDRKFNLIISYNMNGVSIVENYIGYDFSDEYWTLDINWNTVKESKLAGSSFETVDLGLPSGRLWAAKNIGATSVGDYGQYFQWGDIIGYGGDVSDGKLFSLSSYKYGNSTTNLTKYNSTDNLSTLEVEDDAAVVNMGGRWRMPDKEDFDELSDPLNCSISVTSNFEGSGISGFVVISNSNRNVLFIPNAGRRIDNNISELNKTLYLWTRNRQVDGRPGTALVEMISGSNGRFYSDPYPRYFGYPIRGVMDQPN